MPHPVSDKPIQLEVRSRNAWVDWFVLLPQCIVMSRLASGCNGFKSSANALYGLSGLWKRVVFDRFLLVLEQKPLFLRVRKHAKRTTFVIATHSFEACVSFLHFMINCFRQETQKQNKTKQNKKK